MADLLDMYPWWKGQHAGLVWLTHSSMLCTYKKEPPHPPVQMHMRSSVSLSRVSSCGSVLAGVNCQVSIVLEQGAFSEQQNNTNNISSSSFIAEARPCKSGGRFLLFVCNQIPFKDWARLDCKIVEQTWELASLTTEMDYIDSYGQVALFLVGIS